MSNNTLVGSQPGATARTRPPGPSFVGLVGVELRRLWWRRLTKLAAVAAVAFVALTMVGVHNATSPAEVERRLADYNSFVASQPAQLEQCLADEKRAQESDPAVDFGCEGLQRPTPAEFGLVLESRGALITETSYVMVYLLGFLAYLVGASFVAAEFSTGSMANWLTFQPRRPRVATSKLTAATLGGLVLGVVAIGLTVLGVTVVTALNSAPDNPQLPVGPEVAPGTVTVNLLRVVVAVALGGLGGAALAFVMRSTAGVIGFAIGYTILVEGFIANAFGEGRYRPWFLQLHLDAFIQNGATYYYTECDQNGCQSAEQVLSYTQGWVYLLAVAVVGVVVALLVFRRRDVS